MLYHLAPTGSMGLLLANGSMSSNINNEGEIRKNLLAADSVECMAALPGQLFTNTQIPACIWFLTNTKKKRNGFRDRTGTCSSLIAASQAHNAPNRSIPASGRWPQNCC